MTAACQHVSVASDIPEKERKHLRRSLLSPADVAKWNPAPSFITPKSQDEFLRYGKNAFNIKIFLKKTRHVQLEDWICHYFQVFIQDVLSD